MIELFDFGSKLLSFTIQVVSIGLKKNEHNINDEWNLIKGDYKSIDFPVIFKQKQGKNWTDILDTGWVNFFLISERMKVILESNKLTGWQIFPVEIYDKKGNEIFGYHGFSVIGRCSPIDYKKSEIIIKKRFSTGPECKFYKGIFIDEWNGMDFFTPEDNYQIIVTRKAAEILKENKISNMRLENLADMEMSVE